MLHAVGYQFRGEYSQVVEEGLLDLLSIPVERVPCLPRSVQGETDRELKPLTGASDRATPGLRFRLCRFSPLSRSRKLDRLLERARARQRGG